MRLALTEGSHLEGYTLDATHLLTLNLTLTLTQTLIEGYTVDATHLPLSKMRHMGEVVELQASRLGLK